MTRLFQILIAAAAVAFASVASAAPVRTPNAESELVSTRAAVAPGETVTLVLRQVPRAGWHTYWINPGDSGLATTIAWTLPQGYSAGPLLHPAPRIERLGPVTTYVHDRETLYPVAIRVPAEARPGSVARISAKVDWLICADVCVPEQATFALALPVRAQGADDPRGAALAARAVAALPEDMTSVGFGFAAGDKISVTFPGEGASDNPLSAAIVAGKLRNPEYFPYSQSLIDHAAPQETRIRDGVVRIATSPSFSFVKEEARGEGLLVAEVEEGGRWARRAFMFGRPPGEGPLPDAVTARWSGAAVAVAPTAPAPPPTGMIGAFVAAMAAAFLGGLILNVMPCVFPVLSIKALALAGGAQAGAARRHGLFFFAGVMATFLALAGALLAFQTAGASIGWGFQLQEPIVVAALALLFFVIGLNLLGAFHIGGSAQDAGGALTQKGGDAGAFFTGALAVVAATPCTAPFMAGALGWAATQPPAAALAVFAGLGAGFATPFTALSFAPGLMKRLPKPGPWMERVRQLLAFPMFGAAVWLVWVHAVQTGALGAAALLAVFLAAAFLVWTFRQGGAWRAVGVVMALAIAAVAWRPLTEAAPASQAAATDAWSPARVAELTAAGTPVFVNFTAAWCVTCKANEAAALARPEVRDAFAAAGVVYLVADWTARDDVIAAALAAHGRSGVPLYLYYPPGAATPTVLPQLLTVETVLEALRKGETP